MLHSAKFSDVETPYNIPLYYPAEVARFVKISTFRVRRWLQGYEYFYDSEWIKQPPVIKKRDHKIIPYRYASFYDLVRLLFVKRFLDYGLSLQKVRRAFAEAEQILGTNHFIHQSFFTDGKNICLKIRNKGRGDAILELLSQGQWVISEVIEKLAYQIDFDTSTQIALRWFPPEGKHLVVLDPQVSFGRPIVFKKSVTTENIYNLYIAEEKNADAVAEWMDLDLKEVSAAISFEENLAG